MTIAVVWEMAAEDAGKGGLTGAAGFEALSRARKRTEP